MILSIFRTFFFTPQSRVLPVCCLLILFGLTACAQRNVETLPQPPTQPETSKKDQVASIWQRYVARADTARIISGPFRISANLRYTDADGKSERVSSLLWGNGAFAPPSSLRLDLLTGIGTVVAKIKEDGDSVLAYSPEENTVYIPADDKRALNAFGVPIPLSLGELTLMLTGHSDALFLPPHPSATSDVPQEHALTEKGARFELVNARLPGILELSPQGAPLSWREVSQEGWSIVFEPGKDDPLQPDKIRFAHPEGFSALVVVKEASRVSPPYTKEQMELAFPPGTMQKIFAP